MKLTFDISATEFVTVRDILADIVPTECRVWVFGSRAKNQARFNSDLDLAVESNGKLPPITLHRLKEAFNEAALAYRVDVLDINDVSESFQTIIRQQAITFPLAKSDKVPKMRFPEFLDAGAWEEKRLGELGETYGGLTGKTKESFGSGESYIQYMQIFSGSKIDISGCGFVEIGNGEKQNQVQFGDVFFTTSSETPLEIGTASVLLDTVKQVYLNSFCFGYRPNLKMANPAFLQFAFREQQFRKKIVRLAQGSTRFNMSKIALMKISIGLTSLPEQQKIADFLSAIDTKIVQITKKKALLEHYKKGVMQKLFSQELRFKDAQGKAFPDWVEKRLGEVAETTTGSSNREDSTEVGEFAFFDRSTDQRASSRYLFDCEAIIVAGEGKDFPPQYFVGKFDLHQRAYATMNFGNNVGKYLFYWIHFYRHYFLKYSVGSTMPSLRMASFSNFPVGIPAPKEQQKITNFLSDIDQKIDLVATELSLAKTFKKGLLQQMFV